MIFRDDRMHRSAYLQSVYLHSVLRIPVLFRNSAGKVLFDAFRKQLIFRFLCVPDDFGILHHRHAMYALLKVCIHRDRIFLSDIQGSPLTMKS